MASSDSSRDGSNNNTNKNNNNDNIFLQFKRNVDHQISAILSGFIGVPSHMKRNERDEDNRWQDIEDERQRRIDERARDQQYTASQAQKSTPPTVMKNGQRQEDDEEFKISVKKYRVPAQKPIENNAKCPHFNYDYDLYSPFTAAELERLTAACKLERPAHLRILAGVQERFFASMKDTWHASQDSEMAKEKTLMPYLLFSDHSPLRLTHLPQLRRRDMPPMLTFSYAEAFEDLLEMSKDQRHQTSPFEEARDLFAAFGVPSDWTLGLNSALGRPFSRQPMRSPLTAMEWIAGALVEKDVFREETLYETIETPIGAFRAGQYSATTEVLLNWMEYRHAYEEALRRVVNKNSLGSASPFQWPKEENDATKTHVKAGPRTEQDMYDDFFSTPPAARVKYMDNDEVEERGGSTGSATSSSSPPTQSFGTQTSVLDHAPAPSPPESEAHKNPWSWSSIQKPDEAASGKVVLISNVPDEAVSSEGHSGGLVSHEVTEESETLLDGTVKTTVITKKAYQNGKSQVTISTSFDKPAERRDVSGVAGAGDSNEDGKGVVTKVKEWFWK